MADLLIINGRVLDPTQNLDDEADILLRDGVVAKIGKPGEVKADVEVLDAAGLTVVPGLIDMHVHFREPGMEAEETIASGSAAAVAGGFTSVACMPNTDPPLDSEAMIGFVVEEAKKAALANVFPVGAVTAGRKGEQLAEMAQMTRGGAVAFSDDGSAVPTAGLLRQALSYAGMLNRPILEHCEDPSLAGEGVMNEGFVSTVLGMPSIPDEAEEVMVARDVAIAKLTGAHLHVQHISTAGSVEIIRAAKAQGVRVTAEVAPHHLVLVDEAVRSYNPVFKVNPPLRTKEDVRACIKGLKEGTIDVIASDHAPHLPEEKEVEFAAAPCGMIGLETTLGVLLTHLVHGGELTLAELLPKLTSSPSAILNLGRGSLAEGLPGDVTLIDLDCEWVVDPGRFKSKSTNCPFRGETFTGAAAATVVAGRLVYVREG